MKNFDINKFQRENRYNFGHAMMVKIIECQDGSMFSIQASYSHYCQPRENLVGEYISFEVAQLQNSDFTRCVFLDNLGLGTDDDVYGQIPSYTINNLIENHGGFKQGLTHEEAW